MVVLGGCPSPAHTPSGFEGRETETWIAFDLEYAEPPGDLFSPFDARAQSLGCRTEWISTHIRYHDVGYGVAAHCAEGGIALLAWPGKRMRIGCEKPTTRDRCERLLKEISEGRSHALHSRPIGQPAEPRGRMPSILLASPGSTGSRPTERP